ncbi:nucleotide exchange factor GrpE [uncultured Faecalicoccus sp.]|uniref:nucleotide exchange factor GrpE n=1 Tax=uncultured Faecalicoccus sp. TaxID=1971760 RepID=UPI0026289187|nr:nucleotide exchange factor GrpE [uncultured Faecalicoccus sp.]
MSEKNKKEKKLKKEEEKEIKEEEQQASSEEKNPLEEEIEKLNEELAKAKNDMARAYADTENMKKRLQNEADQVKKYRFQQAGLEILPILDGMERALMVQSENEEVLNYVKGFEMIHQQLLNVLTNEGVKEIEALGKPFDHNTMQALMQEAKEDTEPGIVIEVMQKGYMLKDRILRPALVKVSE